MHLDYIALRLIRHYTPRRVVHFLLRHNLIILPGYETRAPKETVVRYLNALEQTGRSIHGRRVLSFGYGGNFALACGLLQAGAMHVTLIDKFAHPDNARNQKLLPEYAQYLVAQNGNVIPRPEFITLLDGDIFDFAMRVVPPVQTASNVKLARENDLLAKDADGIEPFDIILSSSVYEHLNDVDGITQALKTLTCPDGLQVHFIDLRDHYFKYPFEMLIFSEATWQRWLNPNSNLNRYRLKDYQAVFEKYFHEVHLHVMEKDIPAFNQVSSRIRPKFLSGDIEVDAVTLISALVIGPRQATIDPNLAVEIVPKTDLA